MQTETFVDCTFKDGGNILEFPYSLYGAGLTLWQEYFPDMYSQESTSIEVAWSGIDMGINEKGGMYLEHVVNSERSLQNTVFIVEYEANFFGWTVAIHNRILK